MNGSIWQSSWFAARFLPFEIENLFVADIQYPDLRRIYVATLWEEDIRKYNPVNIFEIS